MLYIEIEFNFNIDKTMLHVVHRNWHMDVRVHRFLLHGRTFFDESVFDEIRFDHFIVTQELHSVVGRHRGRARAV